ncbi:MAG: hypothetical protein ACOYXO_15970 [Chloroflexota bacterium]
MIRKIEMALLNPSKETERKLRWSAQIEEDQTNFHLYIPKWRVPKPWPGRIYVTISLFDDSLSDWTPKKTHTRNLEKNIQTVVKPFRNHTKTRRYKPLGDQSEWEIGEPYIPYSLIPEDFDHLLLLEVEWDLSSKGQFINVPTYRDDDDDYY